MLVMVLVLLQLVVARGEASQREQFQNRNLGWMHARGKAKMREGMEQAKKRQVE